MNTFSIKEAIRFGWETFKKRPGFFIGTFLVINIFSNLSLQAGDVGMEEAGGMTGFVFFVISVALFFVNMLAKMGGTNFLLKAHDTPETVVFKDAWSPNPFWRFVGTTLLKGLIIAGPLAIAMLIGAISYLRGGETLFYSAIIVGIPAALWMVYSATRLAFAEMIVMDKKLMPVEALKESYRLTAGSFWQLVLFMLALGGVILLGLIALVVGLLVAIPVTMLAYAYVYRHLQVAQPSAPQL